MKIYIVACAFQGCISDVKAYLDWKEAAKELVHARRELGIDRAHQEENQNSVSIYEVEIN